MHAQAAQHRVEDLATDIVEVDVDAVGAGLGQSLRNLFVLVVDDLVRTEFVLQPRALVGPARDGDHATAVVARHLHHGGADRAGGGGHHHGLARLRLADLLQAEVGGQARRAEHRQRPRGMRQGLRVEGAEALAVTDEFLARAGHAADPGADRVARMARFDHLADAGRAHHLAEADRRPVRLLLAHPDAHGRIDRQPAHRDPQLAVAERCRRFMAQCEVLVLGQALGAGDQVKAAAGVGHGGSLDAVMDRRG